MATTYQQTIAANYTGTANKISIYNRFIKWCEGQEKNRLMWLAAALVGHGCALTPITLFTVILSGNYLFFWILTIIAMMSVLVTNLAALPTKFTIPTFLFSIVIDLSIIIYCLAVGFDITATYI